MSTAVFIKPQSLRDVPFHFCPGCHHGIIHKLLASVLDDYNLKDKALAAASVGCSVFLYEYLDVEVVESPHGRAMAVATGLKRAQPKRFVFTFQGDGDLASIGMSHIIHAANRGEKLTVVFVNNTVYGMTGGQMAPTTLIGQKTTTSPHGRQSEEAGHPLKMAELLATLPGVYFSARVAVDNPKNLKVAKKLLAKACQPQLENKGLGFIEFLAACPTNWRLSPIEANKWVSEKMMVEFPLGIYQDRLN